MKQNKRSVIAAAAFAGLLSGASLRATANPFAGGPQDNTEKKAEKNKAKVDKHGCAGKNSCKGHGGCKTGDNGCKGKNTCKGKGGCATDGSKK